MKKVSIVVAVYNAAPYLQECIESLTCQSYKNIEIICVNDGSTDDSLSILNDYASKDIRIQVYSKENEGKGAAPARNMGLDHVSGDYVIVLDSDDFFEPDMVESMVEKAIETDADMVFCTARHYDHLNHCRGSIFKRPEFQYVPDKNPFSYRDCPDYIFQIADFVAWNKLFKRDFLEKNKLRFEGIPISDDQYPSVMGSVLANRIVVINKPFINYRINTGKSQVDSQAKHPEAAYQAIFSVVERMRKLGIYEEVKRSYCNIAILLMRQYFDRMRRYDDLKFLYEKFNKEIFPFLGAENLPIEYFYDHRVGEWYELITNNSLGEVLFQAARSYGSDMTTAGLRFRFPFSDADKGSNIAIVGKGIAGRYWYSQAVLSGYYNEVFWIGKEEDLSKVSGVDKVLYAK